VITLVDGPLAGQKLQTWHDSGGLEVRPVYALAHRRSDDFDEPRWFRYVWRDGEWHHEPRAAVGS